MILYGRRKDRVPETCTVKKTDVVRTDCGVYRPWKSTKSRVKLCSRGDSLEEVGVRDSRDQREDDGTRKTSKVIVVNYNYTNE